MSMMPDISPLAFVGPAQSQSKKINSLTARLKQPVARGWVDRLARNGVMRLFASLTRGTLILREGADVFEFGEPAAQASVVAEVDILHPSFYRFILFGGTVGSGEAYMQGTWQSPDLTRVIEVMVMNLATLANMNKRWQRFASCIGAWRYYWQKNSKAGSKRNISAHYDLSNDFFKLFLDPTLMYSAAIYPSENASLYEASLNKLQRVCDQLALKADDHLLEIGTGWGGLAIYCAQTTGCKVTTVTLSQEQFNHAREQVAAAGLSGQVEVHLCDYRDIQGQYDKLVSIEMIEAVGHQYFGNYFAKCSSLLKPHGKMLLQAITIPHERFERGKYKMDFIRQYIFPGGCLPSQQVIMDNITRHTDMELVNFKDITLDYARTLNAWAEAFNSQHTAVKALGFDDVFIRMWAFYLSYCEGGFRQRVIGTSQWLFAKPLAEVQ
ncbi:MAG TPA: cyclopropane-fatty-acyl-phospholipid synthase family protein [Cellvibrionaceae bacterium]|nr:cyclopropane-fatty-acyl-phospholipid synthase family protein [Cellvibrionaceae bacterium]HMW71553.1 cyclopropane-fatty-acyl-phospholipid synthase family protein [Cellvibrionaceae bacterium]HNG60001.1 cyclopropane-fatty-acyl-phospholipid synthase family protein [Cellvibrionaceae bacterium]